MLRSKLFAQFRTEENNQVCEIFTAKGSLLAYGKSTDNTSALREARKQMGLVLQGEFLPK